MPSEGADLMEEWAGTRYEDDSAPIRSVLADWFEDHHSELLSNATGPSDPAARLDALIEYLRDRFHLQSS
jgi:hypothetical protein